MALMDTPRAFQRVPNLDSCHRVADGNSPTCLYLLAMKYNMLSVKRETDTFLDISL